MNKFRLLKTGHQSAHKNMAIDETVLENISAGLSLPTLRFYGWYPPAISIGYFQSLSEEVDLEACRRFGVDYVRRITGGGAVFHEHEITYSIHIPQSMNLVPSGILESYEKICGGVLKGLSAIGLKAKFVPLNDIIVTTDAGPKKISGNAQTRKKGVILQHGTILMKVDVDKMFALLKVPDEKLKGKMIEDVKQRVTGVSQALGRDVDFDGMLGVLLDGFKNEFAGIDFTEGRLSDGELKRIDGLMREKYSMDEWNKKR